MKRLLLLLMLWATPLHGATVIISDNTTGSFIGDYTGTTDTIIRDQSPTTNYGSSVNLEVAKYEAGNWLTTLIKFDGLSNIPSNATVSTVTFGIYLHTKLGAAITVTFKRLLSARNWIEAEATWNVFATGQSWFTAGGVGDNSDRSATVSATMTTGTSTGQFYTVTSTGQLMTDVQNAINGTNPNYGWHLERTDAASDFLDDVFYSSEGTDGFRPYLSVTYTVPSTVSIFMHRRRR